MSLSHNGWPGRGQGAGLPNLGVHPSVSEWRLLRPSHWTFSWEQCWPAGGSSVAPGVAPASAPESLCVGLYPLQVWNSPPFLLPRKPTHFLRVLSNSSTSAWKPVLLLPVPQVVTPVSSQPPALCCFLYYWLTDRSSCPSCSCAMCPTRRFDVEGLDCQCRCCPFEPPGTKEIFCAEKAASCLAMW